jgi:putative ABC transport system permease protein
MRILAFTVPVLQRLRTHWRSTLVIITLAALGAGLLGPTGTLGRAGAAISLPPIPSAGPELLWTPESLAPAQIQQQSLERILEMLSVLGWLGFAVAAVSIFSSRAAEAPERAQDTSIRRAVGASLRQVVWSMVIETALLAVIALLAGLAIGAALLAIGRTWWPGMLGNLSSGGPAVALALSAVLGAAGLTSLGLVRGRHLKEPPAEEIGLKLPAYQVGVAVALLMGSAALLSGNPATAGGQENTAESALVYRVESTLQSREERAATYAALLDTAGERTGASAVSLSSAGFPLGLGSMNGVTTHCGTCYFGGIQIRWPNLTALVHAVSADSFRASGLPLLEGRSFTGTDRVGAPRVAIVNRHLASRYFQGGEAIGREIFLGPDWPEVPYRVVGVVDDRRATAIGGSLQPRETVYLSILQHPPSRVELLLPAAADGGPASPVEGWASGSRLGAGGSITPLGTLGEYFGVQQRAGAWIGAGFGVAAGLVLVMALLGTLATARRWADALAWELALRRAVGASRRRMMWHVGIRTAVIGIFGGTLGLFFYASIVAPALAQAMPGMALGNPALLGRAAVVPVLLALVAGILPAVRLLRRPPGTLLH